MCKSLDLKRFICFTTKNFLHLLVILNFLPYCLHFILFHFSFLLLLPPLQSIYYLLWVSSFQRIVFFSFLILDQSLKICTYWWFWTKKITVYCSMTSCKYLSHSSSSQSMCFWNQFPMILTIFWLKLIQLMLMCSHLLLIILLKFHATFLMMSVSYILLT